MTATPGKLDAKKLSACVPYECPQGRFLQLPFCSVYETQIDNTKGSGFGNGFMFVPGNEQGAPAKYNYLIHAMSSIVSLPYTYCRVQWPDGHYLSNVPVDLWSMVQTGRNGRLFSRPKFIPKGSVIRMELGTNQTSAVVQVQIFYEGCILIPA